MLGVVKVVDPTFSDLGSRDFFTSVVSYGMQGYAVYAETYDATLHIRNLGYNQYGLRDRAQGES